MADSYDFLIVFIATWLVYLYGVSYVLVWLAGRVDLNVKLFVWGLYNKCCAPDSTVVQVILENYCTVLLYGNFSVWQISWGSWNLEEGLCKSREGEGGLLLAWMLGKGHGSRIERSIISDVDLIQLAAAGPKHIAKGDKGSQLSKSLAKNDYQDISVGTVPQIVLKPGLYEGEEKTTLEYNADSDSFLAHYFKTSEALQSLLHKPDHRDKVYRKDDNRDCF